jgi:hypothetical protein
VATSKDRLGFKNRVGLPLVNGSGIFEVPNPDKRDKYLYEIIFCQKRAENYFLGTKFSPADTRGIPTPTVLHNQAESASRFPGIAL